METRQDGEGIIFVIDIKDPPELPDHSFIGESPTVPQAPQGTDLIKEMSEAMGIWALINNHCQFYKNIFLYFYRIGNDY